MTGVFESCAWGPFSTLLRGRGLLSARAGRAALGINATLTVSALKCWTASCRAQSLVLHLTATIQRNWHAYQRFIYHAYIYASLEAAQ